jgi:hypothetical protein
VHAILLKSVPLKDLRSSQYHHANSYSIRHCRTEKKIVRIRRLQTSAKASLELRFFREFEPIFETALDHQSEDQVGSFAKTSFLKKISCKYL